MLDKQQVHGGAGSHALLGNNHNGKLILERSPHNPAIRRWQLSSQSVLNNRPIDAENNDSKWVEGDRWGSKRHQQERSRMNCHVDDVRGILGTQPSDVTGSQFPHHRPSNPGSEHEENNISGWVKDAAEQHMRDLHQLGFQNGHHIGVSADHFNKGLDKCTSDADVIQLINQQRKVIHDTFESNPHLKSSNAVLLHLEASRPDFAMPGYRHIIPVSRSHPDYDHHAGQARYHDVWADKRFTDPAAYHRKITRVQREHEANTDPSKRLARKGFLEGHEEAEHADEHRANHAAWLAEEAARASKKKNKSLSIESVDSLVSKVMRYIQRLD